MHVVFIRAANVGGNNVFRPKLLATSLAHLDLVNIGAAGTFVVKKRVSVAAARAAITDAVPFEPKMMILAAKDVLALVDSDPFRGARFTKDLRGWVAALDRAPVKRAKLPAFGPREEDWAVRVDRVEGRFALGFWQRRPGGFVIPANFLEKTLGVSATVRWWETFVRIAKAARA